MPQFVYEGPGSRLVIGGRTLVRGLASELEGTAAESAERHPQIYRAEPGKPRRSTPPAGMTPAGVSARQALVARARELGIPARGKNAALQAAIAGAEQAAMDIAAAHAPSAPEAAE